MRKWIKTVINSYKDLLNMKNLFLKQKPLYGAFDTETTGLHIIEDKPFLFQFGWLHPKEYIGYTFVVDIEQNKDIAYKTIEVWIELCASLKKNFAHNIKFDMHMLTNIGFKYPYENLSDSMYYIRAAHDNLTEKNGGPPMQLKPYAARYITRDARDHDKLIQQERSAIAKMLNEKLKVRLNNTGAPPAYFKARSYTAKVLDALFKDSLIDFDDLPTEQIKTAYSDWLQLDVPAEIRTKIRGRVNTADIPYNWCNRDLIIQYGHNDIVYVLEIVEKLTPVITARDNWKAVEIEEQLIFPLYEMERVGFNADKDYLLECKRKTKAYILQLRQKFAELTGDSNLTIGQHQKVLAFLNKQGANITSTGNDHIARVLNDHLHAGDKDSVLVQTIQILQKLRTLEKWYSTYILRFIDDLNISKTGRLYTTINSVGAVSGRVTSDFQQFPKQPITTDNGEELFHPRKLIKVSGGHYKAIVYLDYSQIELRFQALYTILVGHPDLNLCRAYMPYKCYTILDDGSKKEFDYNDHWCIENAYNRDWYYNEKPDTVWTATDVHGATTKAAFNIDETHPDFHDLRYIGKRVNFAKNYGAKFHKIWDMFPEYDEETAHRIDDAYYKAFPGVKEYHNYCYARAEEYSNTQNLFGIRYYGLNGHKLINCLIQGSAAYFLKLKIRKLYDYAKTHNLKTRWQMQIHDELSWEVSDEDDLQHLFEFKKIMQEWEDGLVPIIADMEITKTTWAEKIEVNTLDEVRQYFST
jgi:DNA polymerase-1